MAIRSRDEYHRQRTESQAVEAQLRLIEQAERDLLRELRWPDDINALADRLLRGRGRKADRERAHGALMALLYVRETRAQLNDENPRRATYAALQAGAWAGDLALRRFSQAGGREQGAKIANAAAGQDREIKRLLQRWTTSDELQDQYRSAVPYIAKKTSLGTRKIQRRLKHLSKKSRQ